MEKELNKKTISNRIKIVLLVFLWLVFEILNYFIFPYFVIPISWLLVCIILLILLAYQIIKTIKERKNLKGYRITNIVITALLFILTFYNFNSIPSSTIEKIDWNISYHKRQQIVGKILNGELKPNSKMNNGICHLPFDFPIISNGGNDILIFKNESKNTVTVKFWISRGFFSSPQTYFIYTNDKKTKRHYQRLISTNPEYNYKLEDNWYRIMEGK